MADATYCSQCGSRLGGGNRFCPSCGSPVDDRQASMETDEDSPGILGRIGTGLAAVVAIPLAILMSLVGLVLPFLFIAALIWGPGETWDRVQAWMPGGAGGAEAAGCEGFYGWSTKTASRQDDMYVLVEPVLKREVTDPAALRAISSDLRGYAREQKQSHPPAEAEKLNDTLVAMYDLMADMTVAMANGDIASFPTLRTQYETALNVADDEDKRVRQECL